MPPRPRLPSGRNRPRILRLRTADGYLYPKYTAAFAVLRYFKGTGMVAPVSVMAALPPALAVARGWSRPASVPRA